MNHSHNSLTRRQFLAKGGATAVAATAVAATAVAATGLSTGANAERKVFIGNGSHKYECVHDWLKLPNELKWGDTQGCTRDSKGNIYVTHTVNAASESKDAVAVFDRNGNFLRSFGSRFLGGGHGIECRREKGREYLYHCDTAHRRVVKTDLLGKTIWEKGRPEEVDHYRRNPDAAFIPTNIAFSPNGDFYVADGYGSDYVMQYDQKGSFIRAFGGRGKEPGQFVTAHGIYVDDRFSEPMLVVTERGSARLQYLTMEGKHIRWVSESMRLPCYFDTYQDLLLVADLKNVVTILDSEHKLVVRLGDGSRNPELRGKPRTDYPVGQFIHPHGGIFLGNGDILIAEWLPDGRMTLLRRVRS